MDPVEKQRVGYPKNAREFRWKRRISFNDLSSVKTQSAGCESDPVWQAGAKVSGDHAHESKQVDDRRECQAHRGTLYWLMGGPAGEGLVHQLLRLYGPTRHPALLVNGI